MGIIDFREICSANANYSRANNYQTGLSNNPDDFELFCQEFFTQVKRFRIFKSISNGPDLGIDLGVEEVSANGTIRWLVSCKHYAHSSTYISDKVELNIVERVGSWSCDGFIPFYTSVPSSTLSMALEGAEKYIKVDRYYKDRIERELLTSSLGSSLASRYFPKSMTNHYPNFISPVNEYQHSDVKLKNGVAELKGMKVGIGIDHPNPSLVFDSLIRNANILAGFEKHEPYFIRTLQEIIEENPTMFQFSNNAHPYGYTPTWNIQGLIDLTNEEGLSKTYFILSVWSFWDYGKANRITAEFLIFRADDEINTIHEFEEHKKTDSYKSSYLIRLEAGLLTPGFLGLKIQDKERDKLCRLLAYTNIIKEK